MEAAKIGRDLRLADATSVDSNRKPLMKNLCLQDCERSLFFFRFSKGSARACERGTRAFSHARGHLRVSGVLLDGPRKKRDCS